MEDEITFAEEVSESSREGSVLADAWKLMIVDDDEEVHRITQLALRKFDFAGRGLSYLNAFSGREARRLIRANPDTAVILLDVVMETENSGLELVRYVRRNLKNRFARIILRTGHPGQAPERKVITEYDINDYKEKTELTALKLFSSVTAAIRSYKDLRAIENGRKELERTIEKLEAETENRIRAEEALRQSRKMEAIGTLAGGIAHDFNNLLMTIMMNTEFALNKSQQNNTVRESLELSLTAIRRAGDLVDQILTFSRKSENKKYPLKVASLVKETLKIVRSSLPSLIEIHADFQAEQSLVRADPTQIQQVVLNLCSNAAHAMRENTGKLTVALTRETVDAENDMPNIQAGCYVRLTVTDTGCGMVPEVLEKAFDPFFTTKKPGEGTGMGLSVALGIIEGIGGKIQVKSDPGKGATFDVFLPEFRGDEAFDETTLQAFGGGNGRILIVDDEKPIVDTMTRTLGDMGYSPTGKTSALEALETFGMAPDKFDLVITDLTMPGMNGKKLAAKIHTIRADIPIIILTGMGDEEMNKNIVKNGIRIIRKPVRTDELLKAIAALPASGSEPANS